MEVQAFLVSLCSFFSLNYSTESALLVITDETLDECNNNMVICELGAYVQVSEKLVSHKTDTFSFQIFSFFLQKVMQIKNITIIISAMSAGTFVN